MSDEFGNSIFWEDIPESTLIPSNKIKGIMKNDYKFKGESKSERAGELDEDILSLTEEIFYMKDYESLY